MTAVAEETRLQALGALRLLDTPREERFDRIVRLAKRLFDVPIAVVSLIDADRQYNLAEIGVGLEEVPRSHSFCQHTIRDTVPMIVTDPAHDPRFAANPWVTGDHPIRFYAGQPLATPAGINVGALCIVDDRPRELSRDQVDLLRELADFVEAELARTDEIDRAGELQRSLLPRTTPQLTGYDVAGVCLPAAAVGGDFYDWQHVGDGFQVVLADVMGKGVPAALIGASLRSLMRGASRFNDLETAVNRAAYVIESDLAQTSTFVTMLAARLDTGTHTLSYVDAGHGLAGIVTHQGKAEQFESDGLPLGAPAWEPWRAEHVVLEPGDAFIALSDGALDLFESLDEAREAAREMVVACASAQEIVDTVASYARRHGATDDVTCVVVRRLCPDESS